MPKTGSGALRQFLYLAVVNCSSKPTTVEWERDGSSQPGRQLLLRTPVQGHGSARVYCPEGMEDCTPSRACYLESGDAEGVPAGLRRRTHFVLGSVREPCAWHASKHNWFDHGEHPWDRANARQYFAGNWTDPPYRSASAAFRESHSLVASTPITLDAAQVDCWIFTDHLEASTVRCLREFEAQGGRVRWHDETLRKYLFPPISPPASNCSRLAAFDSRGGKNAPGGHGVCVSDSRCSQYFLEDRELAELVEQQDAQMYRAFGWAGCCNASRGSSSNSSSITQDRPELLRD